METLDNENIVKKPFVNYTLEEDKEETNSETLTIRINTRERELLEVLKVLFNYSQDAKVIKISLAICKNVTLGTFGPDIMEKITEGNRRRPVREFRIENDKLVKL